MYGPSTQTTTSAPYPTRSIYSDPSSPQISAAGPSTAVAMSVAQPHSQSVNRRRSPSPPPPPPIAAPLLEMGFSLRHINRALNATGRFGEICAHTINTLATWMLENPCIDSDSDTTVVTIRDRRDTTPSSHRQTPEMMPPRQQSLDCTESEATFGGGSGCRRACTVGSRRRACSDIRNYLVERSSMFERDHRDRERQHGTSTTCHQPDNNTSQPLFGSRSLDGDPGLESPTGSVVINNDDVSMFPCLDGAGTTDTDVSFYTECHPFFFFNLTYI